MKKTVTDFDFSGKTVIIRVDFNVPIADGVIKDDTRIRASLKTIEYILRQNAKVILLSHLGKVKEESDKQKNDLYPVSVRLSELLSRSVLFSKKTRGEELESMVSSLDWGDVLLVQNTRYEDLDGNKESGCDWELASYWASLGDIFINDAYGTCHRKHASNVGICNYLPSGVGFLVEEEITKLDALIEDVTHPFIVIMGGAKVSDKIKVIENLILKCDKIIIGGGMAYTFLVAKGINVGSSLVDEDSIDFCRKILLEYGEKIVLPVDHVVSTSLTSMITEVKSVSDTSSEEMGLDIGPLTVEKFIEELREAKRVIINGPMGCFENDLYSKGTKALYDFITSNNIKTLIGGGDTASSVNKLSAANKFYHVSTGGGATLKYLEGTVLPGIGAINEKD